MMPGGGSARRARPEPVPVADVVEYKALLKRVLDNRPSGSRLRLAHALGKNRSFVSQICNPAYPTPIPAGHVDTILEICHFSAAEKREFLGLYAKAHPRSARAARGAHRSLRSIVLAVPDLGNAERNRQLDQALAEFVRHIARILAPDTHDQSHSR